MARAVVPRRARSSPVASGLRARDANDRVMFVQTAAFYDALAAARGSNYDRACDAIAQLVPARDVTASLLDVGCGYGARLAAFERLGFTTHGIDTDAALVALARARCPDATIAFVADMCEGPDFAVGATFDVVTILGSAAARSRVTRRLDALVERLVTHLAPGGALVVEPSIAFADYRAGTIGSVFVDEPARKIARMSLSRQVGRIGVIDLNYLAATPLGVERFFERREIGLFDEAAYLYAFECAGLRATRADVSHADFPYGLWIASR